MPVTAYDTVAANNNAAPPNGAPEGMQAGQVNNVIRQNMADTAVEAQTNAVKVLNSISGTNTITADMNPELAAYSAGMTVIFTPANTNTGAVTISIDGLTALDILKLGGVALVAGDLIAGVPAVLVLDSGADDFYLLNPQCITGTFNGAITGCTAGVSIPLLYKVTNGVATLSVTDSADHFGTSNTTAMTMTGLPAAIQPAAPRHIPVLVVNSGQIYPGYAYFDASGTVTFAMGSPHTVTGFTNSGSKGLLAGFTASYPLYNS